MSEIETEYFTRAEAAAYMRVSKRTLVTWISNGTVVETRIRGISRISREELDRVARNHRRDNNDPNTNNK